MGKCTIIPVQISQVLRSLTWITSYIALALAYSIWTAVSVEAAAANIFWKYQQVQEQFLEVYTEGTTTWQLNVGRGNDVNISKPLK